MVVTKTKCTELTKDKKQPKPCRSWATESLNGQQVCDKHFAMIINREILEHRKAQARMDTEERIDNYLRWKKDHPSVWD